ncbi:MAG: GNAT family N-acetyltransferase [Chloroflexi bacterium]|nr:GNAT family N-acetyltransferase [Chloroflexota bacterium]
MIPIIETSRLTLREFRETDADSLHRLLSEDGVLRYFPNPNPPSLERVQRFIALQLAHWGEHSFGWWAVTPRGEQELIGWNGLQFLPETHEIEVGYLLAKPYWGRGFAIEGARAGMKFGFETLSLRQIIAVVHPHNFASQHVLEKLGMAWTGWKKYFGMDVFRYVQDRPTRAE